MPFKRLINWMRNNWLALLFRKKKIVRLGLYGPPNAGKTTLANKISMDWTGEPLGTVSEVPHETREVQKKEKVVIRTSGKKIELNLLDMPGISTKVDFREFVEHGMSVEDAQMRAKEATRGVIEAIKWLEHVDVALVVLDATRDPYTQVNITIIGNLEARKIPILIVANKLDLEDAKPEIVREAFPQHELLEISAKEGDHIEELYEAIAKHAG